MHFENFVMLLVRIRFSLVEGFNFQFI